MKNTVAIVTGASQGIGRSTALRLAQDFSSLVLAARNGDALKEVSKAVDQAGVQVLPLPLDLREPAADKTLVDETLKRLEESMPLSISPALFRRSISSR
jgi:3-oxoacyl-[acyl-carrier protein] reductase